MRNKRLPDYVDEYATTDGENRRLVNNGHGWFNAVNHDAIKRASCGCDQWCALFNDQTGVVNTKHATTVKKKTYTEWDKSETGFVEGQEYRIGKKKKITENICDFCGEVLDSWETNTETIFAVPTDKKCACKKDTPSIFRLTKNGNGQCETCGRIEEWEDGKQEEE